MPAAEPDIPMPTSLASYIRESIDWNPEKDFDLDLDRITARFPDVTEADLDHALTRVAAVLRLGGRRSGDQALLDQADAFDDMTPVWVERLGVPPGAAASPMGVPRETLDEEILAAASPRDMASLRSNITGVDNTIFVSVKLLGRAPCIRVAIDPPTHLDPFGNCTVMFIGDGSAVAGTLPARVREQAAQFIALNRQVLLDYWDCRFATAELLQRVRAIRT
jgi:hypothetical protein